MAEFQELTKGQRKEFSNYLDVAEVVLDRHMEDIAIDVIADRHRCRNANNVSPSVTVTLFLSILQSIN